MEAASERFSTCLITMCLSGGKVDDWENEYSMFGIELHSRNGVRCKGLIYRAGLPWGEARST